MEGSSTPQRLAVDLSSAGVARVALVDGGPTPAIGAVQTYDGAAFSTLTEVFQTFERTQGVSLQNSDVAIAIAGIAVGTSIPITRSRWTLARSGLTSYFGRPVIIVNEVAAKAWAVFGAQTGTVRQVVGQSMPAINQTGRWAFISLADGLGVAAINVDFSGQARVLETEAGHMRFTPFDSETDAVMVHLRRSSTVPTWEAALQLTRRTDSESGPRLEVAREALPGVHARILGAFSVDVVLSLGAWDGVILADQAGRVMANRSAMTAFTQQFQEKRTYTRMLAHLPVWSADLPHVALRGCANLLAHI